jgi:ethanolamine utilization protein EutQ
MSNSNPIQKLRPQAGMDVGGATVFRILTEGHGAGMRIGVAEFQPGSIDLDLTYDEAVYVLDGELHIESMGVVHALSPGDLLWMPPGRQIVYPAQAPCRILFAIPTPVAT